MEPTLMKGDRVIATEIEASELVVGDIVVYANPGRWLAGEVGEGQLIHRVIGTPGDTVTCCDSSGRISINGKPIDEPYLAPGPADCNARIFESATQHGSAREGGCDWTIGPVPEGMLFVLGDRDRSADSRAHLCAPDASPCPQGPWVPVDLVRGIVELP